ncbi:hypothetical protein AAFF_G00360120 [Aldrovandia affinis]|uniref:Uncharacterized protein n=1 Tax=Aldrovandia affinis TaxID=143900 RepID=A0AAD7SI92_9TELE|nr:hypothetical protein AAFF_G00360120 [Aldrovandia affinis]
MKHPLSKGRNVPGQGRAGRRRGASPRRRYSGSRRSRRPGSSTAAAWIAVARCRPHDAADIVDIVFKGAGRLVVLRGGGSEKTEWRCCSLGAVWDWLIKTFVHSQSVIKEPGDESLRKVYCNFGVTAVYGE